MAEKTVAHTPGPWQWDHDGKVFKETPAGRAIICKPNCLPPIKPDEAIGNVLLIAKAPEMYALLKRYSPQHAIALLAEIEKG